MKTLNLKILLIALIASLFFMSSCKKDNDLPLAVKMVGVWKVVGGEIHVTNYEDINDIFDIETEGTITLNDDGTGKDDFTLNSENLSRTLSASYTWGIEENTLTILDSGEEFVWQVEEVKNGFNISQEDLMLGRPDLTMRATIWLRN